MADYRSSLTGTQMDSALLDMAEHNSEAYAVGERNGIAVAPDDVTYHNNARYYAQIASSQIVGDASSAVRWDTDQSEALTSAQKAVARNNIGAASDSDVVKITSQTLTSAQQSQARANIMAGGSNRNLLDNGWFTVRQRGDGAFGTGAQYTVDRWRKLAQGSITGTENGLSIAPTATTSFIELIQYTETSLGAALEGKTITFSLMTADGTVYSKSETVPAKPASGSTNFLSLAIQTGISCAVYRRNTGDLMVDFMYNQAQTQTTFVIRAVKLELGSVSTLANDAPPDYGTELIKCRGYFERINTLGSSEVVGMGFGASSSSVRIGIPSLICHDIKTVTYSGAGLLLEGNGTYLTISSINKLNNTPKNGFLTLTIGASGTVTPYQAYALVGTAAGGYIDISADL